MSAASLRLAGFAELPHSNSVAAGSSDDEGVTARRAQVAGVPVPAWLARSRGLPVAAVALSLAAVAAAGYRLWPRAPRLSGAAAAVLIQESASSSCEETPSVACLRAIDWAMRHGIFEHPENYGELKPGASFASFQEHFHKEGVAGCTAPCLISRQPGAPRALVTSDGSEAILAPHVNSAVAAAAPARVAVRQPASQGRAAAIAGRAAARAATLGRVAPSRGALEVNGCRDAQMGDPCFRAVKWAMQVGIHAHPEWYHSTGLTATSDFAGGQYALYLLGQGGCHRPCGHGSPILAAPVLPPQLHVAQVLPPQLHAPQVLPPQAPAAQVSTSPPAAAQVDTTWRVVYGAVNVRKDMSLLSAALATKKKGDLVKGHSVGPWLQLAGEPGFMLLAVAAGAEKGRPMLERAAEDVTTTTTTLAQVPTAPKCHTAMPGEECYDAVIAARTTGVLQHPEWYGGLAPYSSKRAFQAKFQKEGKSSCQAPCGEAPLQEVKPSVGTFFCWTFMSTNGKEEPLLRIQLDRNFGIFQCQKAVVISTQTIRLGQIGGADFFTTINGDARTKDSWHNSELFASTWLFVINKFQLQTQFDWVVKADPDCVWFVDRLRQHVAQHAVPRLDQYFTNCNVPAGTSKLYGALEIFSKGAINAYNASYKECQEAADWRDLGEDLYMQRCMDILDVAQVGEFTLVGDGRCSFAPCSDGGRVAFHPFKEVEQFIQCYSQATR